MFCDNVIIQSNNKELTHRKRGAGWFGKTFSGIVQSSNKELTHRKRTADWFGKTFFGILCGGDPTV